MNLVGWQPSAYFQLFPGLQPARSLQARWGELIWAENQKTTEDFPLCIFVYLLETGVSCSWGWL